MLLQLIRAFSFIFSVSLSRVCQVQSLSSSAKDASAPTPFIFSLQQSCDNWVVFAWDSPDAGYPWSFGPPDLSSCEITYMNQQSQLARLVMVVLHANVKRIRLSNLNRKTHYAASMTCNETLTSNTVQFVTGYPCSEAEMKEEEAKREQQSMNDTEVRRRPVQVTAASNDYSVTDMALGLFFALCGVTIAGCFGYYYWKKRRHRQRILRIFGQSYSDAFLALNSPSDQPTTNF